LAVVTRFAPSPTGYLHLGHVHAAHAAWNAARQAGGRFLLRLEDIDPQRCKPVFAAAILEDLAWLGLRWDSVVRVQSAHLGEYEGILRALAGRGLAYPCFCSRAEVAREAAASAAAPHSPDGAPLYPGTCRALPAGERSARLARGDLHAWRLDIAAALAAAPGPWGFHEAAQGWLDAAPAAFGDVVLGRRDAPASYRDAGDARDRPAAGHAPACFAAAAAGVAHARLRAPHAADRPGWRPAFQAGRRALGAGPARGGSQRSCGARHGGLRVRLTAERTSLTTLRPICRGPPVLRRQAGLR